MYPCSQLFQGYNFQWKGVQQLLPLCCVLMTLYCVLWLDNIVLCLNNTMLIWANLRLRGRGKIIFR